MKVEYDSTTDSLYIDFNNGISSESEEVADGVVLDFNKEGIIVGIDIQHASTRANIDKMIFERVA